MQFFSLAFLFVSSFVAVTADGLRGRRLQPGGGPGLPGPGPLLPVRFPDLSYHSIFSDQPTTYTTSFFHFLITDMLFVLFALICGFEYTFLGIFSQC